MHEPSVVLATKLLAVSQAHLSVSLEPVGLIQPVPAFVQASLSAATVFVQVVAAGGGVGLLPLSLHTGVVTVVSHSHDAVTALHAASLSVAHVRPAFVHFVESESVSV